MSVSGGAEDRASHGAEGRASRGAEGRASRGAEDRASAVVDDGGPGGREDRAPVSVDVGESSPAGVTLPASLVLIGFMGAGKSAVGMGVAQRRALPFVDSDTVIEQRQGPIAAIFAHHGEARFRALERDVCTELLERAAALPMVVSLGGGAVLSGDVRGALRGIAHVAWLTAPPDVLWSRAIAGSGEGEVCVRPLARDRASFETLLAAREPLYREVATAVVDNGAGRTLDEVVAELVRLTDPPSAAPVDPPSAAPVDPPSAASTDPSDVPRARDARRRQERA